MDNLQDFVKVAKNYKLEAESELKDRSITFKINKVIGRLASGLFKVMVVVGALLSLHANMPLYYLIALGSIGVNLLSEILNTYQEYKIEKLMQEEYEKFLKHMEKEGFTINENGVKLTKDKN